MKQKLEEKINTNYTSNKTTLNSYLDQAYRKILSDEEFHALYLQYRSGDEKAKDELIKHYLRLVIKTALPYQNRGVLLEDLVQEGLMGLIRALESYDGTLEYQFSTYAVFWIKQRLIRAVYNTGRVVRIPSFRHERYLKLRQTVEYLHGKLGRSPSIEEIADELNWSITTVSSYLQLFQPIISLDTPLDTGTRGSEIVNFISDSRYDVKKEVEEIYARDYLLKLLDKIGLTDKQKCVLIYRFGFDGEPLTLQEVGEKLQISRERARQLEEAALANIRKSSYLKEIASLFSIPDATYQKALAVAEQKSMEYIKKEQEYILDKDSFFSYCKDWLLLSSQDVPHAVSKLKPRHQLVLKLAYGADYSQTLNLKNLTKAGMKDKEIAKLKSAFSELHRVVGLPTSISQKKTVTLPEYLEKYASVTEEDCKRMVSNLNFDWQEIIYRAYGITLLEPFSNLKRSTFTEKEKSKFKQILPYMRNPKRVSELNRTYQLEHCMGDFYAYLKMNHPGVTNEMIDQAIDRCTKGQRQALIALYGEDYSIVYPDGMIVNRIQYEQFGSALSRVSKNLNSLSHVKKKK